MRGIFFMKSYAQISGRCESGDMKSIIAIIAIAVVTFIQTGCTTRAGASVGHDGDRHGLSARGSTEGGVSAGVRAY